MVTAIDSRSMLRMLAPRIALTLLAIVAIAALAIVALKHSPAGAPPRSHAPAPRNAP